MATEEQAAEIAKLVGWLRLEFDDRTTPCVIDHHGQCQEHWLATDLPKVVIKDGLTVECDGVCRYPLIIQYLDENYPETK